MAQCHHMWVEILVCTFPCFKGFSLSPPDSRKEEPLPEVSIAKFPLLLLP